MVSVNKINTKPGSTLLLHLRNIPCYQGQASPWGARWKRLFQANESKNQADEAILLSDKIDFKPKLIRRDKEGHYILIKGKIHQEDTAILNIYTPIHQRNTTVYN